MTTIRKISFTYILAGFTFGLTERFLNQDWLSLGIGATFAIALVMLDPFEEV